MATLKTLVDETTNIKDEIVECHTSLSSILTSKNVEISEEDKMSDLISKVELLSEYIPPLYLYKEGNECIDITGGWKGALTYTTSYWTGGQSIGTFNDSCVNLKTSAIRSLRRICTSKKINVSNYNTLYIELNQKTSTSSYGGTQLVVLNSLSEQTNWIPASVKASATGVKVVYSINLSNLNSSYYIGVVASVDYSGAVEADIYNIWLEK